MILSDLISLPTNFCWQYNLRKNVQKWNMFRILFARNDGMLMFWGLTSTFLYTLFIDMNEHSFIWKREVERISSTHRWSFDWNKSKDRASWYTTLHSFSYILLLYGILWLLLLFCKRGNLTWLFESLILGQILI